MEGGLTTIASEEPNLAIATCVNLEADHPSDYPADDHIPDSHLDCRPVRDKTGNQRHQPQWVRIPDHRSCKMMKCVFKAMF